jgi:hydrogenase 3 maturation protease
VTSLKDALSLELCGAKRIALLAIGSELRGDDAAGMLVARHLIKSGKCACLKIFLGETAPENLTGEIRKYKPTHVLIVDAASLGKHAGYVELIDPDKTGGLSFSTHRLPAKIITDYLKKSLGCKSFIIGIQPESIDFGSKPTKQVNKAAKEISVILKKICSNLSRKVT